MDSAGIGILACYADRQIVPAIAVKITRRKTGTE
jgi:hypothetical protein